MDVDSVPFIDGQYFDIPHLSKVEKLLRLLLVLVMEMVMRWRGRRKNSS